MKTFFIRGLLFALIICSTSHLQAEESVPDNFELRAGGYFLTDLKANVAFSTEAGPTAGVDLPNLFNVDQTVQTLFVGGYYRFTPKHSVAFSWVDLKHSGTSDKDIHFSWEGNEINATGNLDTFFDMERYKVQYLYSFYHNDDVELSLGIGVHIAKIDVGFSGDYTSAVATQTGTEVEANSTSVHTDVTAPLPVIGFKLNYNITPALKVNFTYNYFYMTFKDLEGSLADTLLTVDYRVVDNLGLSMGMNTTKIRLVDDVSERVQLTMQYELMAFVLYGTLNF